MRFLIGIDDTDNAGSRGTGFRARELAGILSNSGCGEIVGVTRHQLFVHENIPYTSHNSSACIIIESDSDTFMRQNIINISSAYLIENSAEGSDAGLCVCLYNEVNNRIVQFGRKAKIEVLKMETAYELAGECNIFLQGYTGNKQGIIGALAACGLYKSGNDGRFLLVKGMRELTGIFPAKEILFKTNIDLIKTISNSFLFNFEAIELTEWWKPILENGKAILYVEPINENKNEFKVISREHIKNLSS